MVIVDGFPNFQIKFHVWRVFITPLRAMSAVGQFQVWSLFPARTPSFSREQLQDGSVRNLTTYHSCYNLEKKLGQYFMCCTNMIKESHVFVKCKPCHVNTICKRPRFILLLYQSTYHLRQELFASGKTMHRLWTIFTK